MSLSDLASIGSFVSGVAVLISLIYLALQVRQAERNQKAILQQGRAARNADTVLRIAEPGIVEAFRKARTGDVSLSALELEQFILCNRALMYGMEDVFFQHRNHLLDDAAFDSTVNALRFNMSAPGYRAAWKAMRGVHEPSFRDFVDQIVREAAVAPPVDRLAQWTADVSAEQAAMAG
jgi:hypothetical protein